MFNQIPTITVETSLNPWPLTIGKFKPILSLYLRDNENMTVNPKVMS